MLLEPYLAHRRVGSWARRTEEAGEGSPGSQVSGRSAEGSDRNPTEGCWPTKYWRGEPQAAAYTAASGGPRVAGCSEQQQQNFVLRVFVQKVRR